MAETTTQIALTAVDKTGPAFRNAAQQVEDFIRRNSRAQRDMARSTRAAMREIREAIRATREVIGAFGVGLGLDAMIDRVKEGTLEWAKLEEQFNRIGFQSGKSTEEIKKTHEEIFRLAQDSKTSAKELFDAFEQLTATRGFDAARTMLENIAIAAKGTSTSIADTSQAATKMMSALHIGAAELPRAFNAIAAASRQMPSMSASALMKGLNELSDAFGLVEQKGTRGLNRTLAHLNAISKTAPDATAAISAYKDVLSAIGSQRLEAKFQEIGGVPLHAILEQARKNGNDLVETFVNATDQALENITKIRGEDVSKKFTHLSELMMRDPQLKMAMQALIENKSQLIEMFHQLNIEMDKGALQEAYTKRLKETSATIQEISDIWRKWQEALGETVGVPFLDYVASQMRAIQTDIEGIMRSWTSLSGAWHNLWSGGDAKKPMPNLPPGVRPPGRVTSAPGAAEKPMPERPGEAPTGVRPPGRFTSAPGGARPPIPTEPGSTTEQTAREQLRVLGDIAAEQRREKGLGGEGGGGAGGGGGGGRYSAGSGPSTGGGRGGHGEYNVAKAYELMKSVGATDEEARVLAAIAQPESGGNPNIRNPRGADNSYGLWQINMLGAMGPQRRAKYGLKSNDDLYDPKTNARVALAMHREALRRGDRFQGYGDWTTYRSGAYRAYLPKPGAMAQRPAAKPTGGTPSSHATKTSQPSTDGAGWRKELDRLRSETEAKPIRQKVVLDIDRPGIRDRGEAQSRRQFAMEVRRGRYQSFSDVGVV